MESPPVTDKSIPYPAPKRVAISSGIIAVCIFCVDFVMAAPTFTGFVIVYAVLYLLPATLLSIKNKPKFRAIGTKLVVYTGLFVISFGFYSYDLSLARQRAEVIIAAVDRYQQERGKYPDTLLDLIPGYLVDIPKPRLVPSGFIYRKGPDNTFLMYSALSPFERYSWSFVYKQWTYLD